MTRRILIIHGHPDPRPERLDRALADAYAAGAQAAGHEVRHLDIAALQLPLLRRAEDFTGPPPDGVQVAQDAIRWAEHLAIFHPLWLGAAPAALKAFFEQVFRYGFALSNDGPLARPLRGRSARTVVTMGMPALMYRAVFGAFGVRALERGVLNLAGIWPTRRTLLGGVGDASENVRGRWLARMRALGAAGR